MATHVQHYDQSFANHSTLVPIPTQYLIPGQQLYRLGVPGEGSCFFHSICTILNQDNYFTNMPTSEKEAFIRDFRCFGFRGARQPISSTEWSNFIGPRTKAGHMSDAELETKFCTLETWADQPMIEFVSIELDLNIMFYNVDTGQMFCGVHGKRSQRTVIVAWVRQQHFEPICKIVSYTKQGDSFQNVTCQFVFDQHNDREFLNSLFNHYQSSCSIEIPY